jgi:hypothetical protein
MRRFRLLLIAVGVLVFLVVSALLARVLSVGGAERSAITALVQDESRGDAAGMEARIQGCRTSPSCQYRVEADAAALRRSGTVAILELNASAGFSLTSTTGTARVAWRAGNSLPIVQCVRVKRSGNALSGLHVELLEISARIKSDQDCPARY